MKNLILVITSFFVFTLTANTQNFENAHDITSSEYAEKNQLKVWEDIYQKYFNIDVDLSSVKNKKDMIPIFVAEGITIQNVWNKIQNEQAGGNINNIFSDRIPVDSYVIWIKPKDVLSSDIENNNHLIVDELKITLLEHLLSILFDVHVSGKYLDEDEGVFCLGSRISGEVPMVYWSDGCLRIMWFANFSFNELGNIYSHNSYKITSYKKL